MKQQCPVCKAVKDSKGMRGHIQFAHPNYDLREGFPRIPATGEAQLSETQARNLETSKPVARVIANDVSQTSEKNALLAQLAEKTSRINEQDSRIDVLDKDLLERDARIAALEEEHEDDKARLAEIPMTISDFSTEEKVSYFTEFLKNLTPENKAKMAEATGFGIPLPPPPPTPAVEDAMSENILAVPPGVKPAILLVCNGQRIGTITNKEG